MVSATMMSLLVNAGIELGERKHDLVAIRREGHDVTRDGVPAQFGPERRAGALQDLAHQDPLIAEGSTVFLHLDASPWQRLEFGRGERERRADIARHPERGGRGIAGLAGPDRT